jgi:hypothetical protein
MHGIGMRRSTTIRQNWCGGNKPAVHAFVRTDHRRHLVLLVDVSARALTHRSGRASVGKQACDRAFERG